MRCSLQCNGKLQKGEQIKIDKMLQIFTIIDFTINRFDISLVLLINYNKKMFITRNKHEIKCITCPKHRK